MAKSGVLTVRLLSDTKDLEKGLGRAEKQVKSTGEKFSDAGKKMTVFATVPVVAAMAGATKAASDLEQSVGGVESVFGEASGAITDFGDTAAQTTGLSKRQVNEMAAVIGAGLKGMGFEADEAADTVINLEKRAADMAATFGGTTEEAIDAVASALRGERDPIEKYGVSLKQADVNARVMAMGLDTSTTAAKKKSEALAALDLIMGQTADTEGQFAREADGAAGSMQIAKAEIENASAEIGSALLPIVAKAAGGVADLAAEFGGLPKPVQNGVLALAGVIAVSGPLITATGKIMTGASTAASAIETLRIRAMYAKPALAGVGIVAGGIAVAFGAPIVASKALETRLDNLDKVAGDLAGSSTKALVAAFDDFNGTFKDVFGSAEAAEKQLNFFRITAEENIGTAERLRDALKAEGRDVSELDKVLKDVASSSQQAGEDQEAAADAVDKFGESTGKAEKPTEDLTDAMSDEERQAERLQNAIDKVKEATDRLIGVHLSAESAGLRVTEQFATLTQTLKDNGDTLDINTEKGRNNREAIVNTTEAALSHVEALKEEGASVDEVNFFLAQHVEHLKKTMRQAGLSETEIAGYIETLGLTPDNINTLVRLNGVEAAERALANLSRVRVAQINAQITGARTAGLQVRHSGGPVEANKMYIIGRPGAEELFQPDQSGQIHSGAETDRILGRTGGSTTTARVSSGRSPSPATSADIDRLIAAISSLQVSVNEQAVGTLVRNEDRYHTLRNGL